MNDSQFIEEEWIKDMFKSNKGWGEFVGDQSNHFISMIRKLTSFGSLKIVIISIIDKKLNNERVKKAKSFVKYYIFIDNLLLKFILFEF